MINRKKIEKSIVKMPRQQVASECESKEYKVKLLWVDSENEFTFCELQRHVIIQLNMKDGYWRACHPFEVFGFKKYN